MILVLANRDDSTAKQLVDRWAGYQARLMTCAEFSAAGWRYDLQDPTSATAILNDKQVPIDEITGAVIRLSYVNESELSHITSADRAYVAAEISAFLAFWLSELTCPLLNRPAPGTLCGPCWRREQWLTSARRVGLKVRSEARYLSLEASATRPGYASEEFVKGDQIVTIVGERCFGDVHSTLLERSRCLAELAKVSFLRLHFNGPDSNAVFMNATVYPDPDRPEIADAMLEYLNNGTSHLL